MSYHYQLPSIISIDGKSYDLVITKSGKGKKQWNTISYLSYRTATIRHHRWDEKVVTQDKCVISETGSTIEIASKKALKTLSKINPLPKK